MEVSKRSIQLPRDIHQVFALSTRRKIDTHQSRIRGDVEHFIDVSCYDDHAIASLVQGTFTLFYVIQDIYCSLFPKINISVVTMLSHLLYEVTIFAMCVFEFTIPGILFVKQG
jgi:hypothetical protein